MIKSTPKESSGSTNNENAARYYERDYDSKTTGAGWYCLYTASPLAREMGVTYMAMTIGDVVGQFELVEGDAWFRHPRLARCRWIGMNVHAFRQFRIGFTSHHPLCIVILVTAWHAVVIIKLFHLTQHYDESNLTSSAAAMSINMQYLAFGLSPLTCVL